MQFPKVASIPATVSGYINNWKLAAGMEKAALSKDEQSEKLGNWNEKQW